MPEYLTRTEFTIDEKQLLFKLRCGMTTNKTNFKNMHKSDMTCRLCLDSNSQESLCHLTRCKVLLNRIDGIKDMHEDDIFDEWEKQLKAVKIWKTIFSILEDQEDTRSTSHQVPHVHSVST